MSWREVDLADGLMEVRDRAKEFKGLNLPYIGLEHIEKDTLKLSGTGDVREVISDKTFFKSNDILFGTLRPYFRKVYFAKFEGVCSTDITVLRSKNSQKTHPRFFFYFIANKPFIDYATSTSNGTRMPRAKWKNLIKKPFWVPDYETQHKIASILSAYDDLIENNMRRIKLLEEAARLIYKEWFVRLRFPGHEHIRVVDGVPDGWELKKIADVVKLNYGKALKKDDRIDGEYPVFGSGGIVGYHEKPLVKGPGIIVGRKGNVGSVFWAFKDFYPIDTVYYLSTDLNKLFVYFYFQFQSFVSSDCAVPGLNRNYVYNLPMLIPPKSLIDKFGKLVEPIYNQIEKLEMQNQKLREARDILLPRLMNGSIKV